MAGFYAGYHDITDRKRVEALSSALYRMAEKTSSAQDLQQFYAAIHGIVGELMYARNFYIALYDPATQLLSFPYFVDEQDLTPPPKKLGRGLTEYVLRTGEPLLCHARGFRRAMGNTVRWTDWLPFPRLDGRAAQSWTATRSARWWCRATPKTCGIGEMIKRFLLLSRSQLASAIEHKRNEEALRRSEARYRSLVQSAVYGIYRSSLEGRFLDVNPALIAHAGLRFRVKKY